MSRILITGGAGFIGSNLVEALLNDQRVSFVRVLDNLSTGFEKNILEFSTNSKFEFVNADITNYNSCLKLTEDIDLISHQAALGSVPRSILDPLLTNEVNITGTLNIFNAAVKNNISRVVFAASSSTYGDSEGLPKVEDVIGKPLSPYAVTKYVNEIYAEVFSNSYDFKFIGLRYFNVFGPKQDPFGAYAAVIPLFIKAALENKNPTINGDGSFSRDFTYVDNAIQANINSLFSENPSAINQIYNVACGIRTSLNQLWETIKQITNSSADAEHGPDRFGDIPHSLADISKAKNLLEYNPTIQIQEGLNKTVAYFQTKGLVK
jgi:UDP-N-acetylglucosamine 4-epimerase